MVSNPQASSRQLKDCLGVGKIDNNKRQAISQKHSEQQEISKQLSD